jgi:lysophospholipase L1-like esterase
VKLPTPAAAAVCLLTACTVRAETAMSPQPVKVMLIGDSLSVGPFGRALESALQARFGRSNVCVFASCGSSPEDWLPGRPVFVTKCGYRQTTPTGSISREYQNGKRPPPVRTPKLPGIFEQWRPQLVIVQLGTNWMDRLAAADRLDGRPYRRNIRDFVREVRRQSDPVIVWVMPPDSSKYPLRVHEAVERWIREESIPSRFRTIDSRLFTAPYRDGKTGGDGVHYGDTAGRRWARRVMGQISLLADSLPLAPADAGR